MPSYGTRQQRFSLEHIDYYTHIDLYKNININQ